MYFPAQLSFLTLLFMSTIDHLDGDDCFMIEGYGKIPSESIGGSDHTRSCEHPFANSITANAMDDHTVLNI